MAVTSKKAKEAKKQLEEENRQDSRQHSIETRQDNFSLKSELILSTFERTVEMHTQLTEKMSHLCSCMDKNTAAMTDLVMKLAPVSLHMVGVKRNINAIKYALIPIIVALLTTTVALLFRLLQGKAL